MDVVETETRYPGLLTDMDTILWQEQLIRAQVDQEKRDHG
jgi:hypothetical protein